MLGSDLAVAAIAVTSFYSLSWCLSLSRRLRRIERTSKLDPLTRLGSGDWLRNHGLVTAPASDLANSGPNPPPIVSPLPGTTAQPTTDGVPVEIHEGASTLPLTPAAQALLAAESVGGPGTADDSAEQARSGSERIWRKREAVGWTRRQLSEVCQESESTIKDVEQARRPVAPVIRAKMEAYLDAELAKQGLPSEKQ